MNLLRIKYFLFRIWAKLDWKIIIVMQTALFFAGYAVYAKYEAEKFPDLFTYLYYFSVTMSTVGYGDLAPVSTPGRMAGIMIVIFSSVNAAMILGKGLEALFSISEKLKKGKMKLQLKNHAVIIGFENYKKNKEDHRPITHGILR